MYPFRGSSRTHGFCFFAVCRADDRLMVTCAAVLTTDLRRSSREEVAASVSKSWCSEHTLKSVLKLKRLTTVLSGI